MIDLAELQVTTAFCFSDAGLEPVSAAIYAVRVDDPEPDADLLIVLDGIPSDYVPLRRLYAEISARVSVPVNETWMMLNHAQQELRSAGSLLSEVARFGLHVAGTRLSELVPDAAPYDADAVASHAHDESQRWIARIRNRQFAHTSGEHMALVLESAANVALMHHRLGAIAAFNGTLTNRGLRRLAAVTSESTADELNGLMSALLSWPDADCSEYIADLQRIVDVLLEAASDPAAPGCTIA